MRNGLSDVVRDRYETEKSNEEVRGLFFLEPYYTLWPCNR
jgi:hypothetical protein